MILKILNMNDFKKTKSLLFVYYYSTFQKYRKTQIFPLKIIRYFVKNLAIFYFKIKITT